MISDKIPSVLKSPRTGEIAVEATLRAAIDLIVDLAVAGHVEDINFLLDALETMIDHIDRS